MTYTDDEREALDAVLFYSDPSGEKVFRFADPRVVSGDDTFIDRMIPTILASAPWRNRGRGPITDEAVERAARAMFDDPNVAGAGYTWAEMVVEDPTRADIWRKDARRVLEAALDAEEQS